MINKQEMEWVIALISELEKEYFERPIWHYSECKKIVERMKLIIEQGMVAEND